MPDNLESKNKFKTAAGDIWRSIKSTKLSGTLLVFGVLTVPKHFALVADYIGEAEQPIIPAAVLASHFIATGVVGEIARRSGRNERLAEEQNDDSLTPD